MMGFLGIGNNPMVGALKKIRMPNRVGLSQWISQVH